MSQNGRGSDRRNGESALVGLLRQAKSGRCSLWTWVTVKAIFVLCKSANAGAMICAMTETYLGHEILNRITRDSISAAVGARNSCWEDHVTECQLFPLGEIAARQE